MWVTAWVSHWGKRQSHLCSLYKSALVAFWDVTSIKCMLCFSQSKKESWFNTGHWLKAAGQIIDSIISNLTFLKLEFSRSWSSHDSITQCFHVIYKPLLNPATAQVMVTPDFGRSMGKYAKCWVSSALSNDGYAICWYHQGTNTQKKTNRMMKTKAPFLIAFCSDFETR